MFRTDNPKHLFMEIIAVALIIATTVLGIGYWAWSRFVGKMSDEAYQANAGADIDSNTITEDIFLDPLPSNKESAEASDLKGKIKSWLNTGTPAKDDNVKNILLIGMDLDTPDMKKNSRADAMVLFSINHTSKTINLVSIMRDQYCYLPYNGGKFEKLHHANAYGGPSAQIEMLEKYYKVSIDNYAIVNFYSLPKIIDKLGGVTVNITKNEADYLNSDCGFKISAGENKLDGAQALVYMRIRHNTGGDEARVNRQQNVIKEILKMLKSYSKASLVSLINDITPYIRTGYTPTQMLSLATDALVNKTLDYSINQASLPDNECSTSYTVKESSGNVWYWKVDFPIAARKLQTIIYGKTNIELGENRKSWIS